jgi:transposase InsO family protein
MEARHYRTYSKEFKLEALELFKSSGKSSGTMESFFGSLKAECVPGQFASRALARTTIFEHIEVWYNRQRLHSTPDYCSPVDFEQLSGH